MVHHSSIQYRFSYPAIRYLQIPQKNYTIRFDTGGYRSIYRYLILFTCFKQLSTFLLSHKCNQDNNMNINLKMLLWAQC